MIITSMFLINLAQAVALINSTTVNFFVTQDNSQQVGTDVFGFMLAGNQCCKWCSCSNFNMSQTFNHLAMKWFGFFLRHDDTMYT